MMKGAKIEDLILAGYDKIQYPMTRCKIRKFHPVGVATGEGNTSAQCRIFTTGCANSEVTRPAMTDNLSELSLYLV